MPFSARGALFALLWVAQSAFGQVAAEANRPNLLLIVAEDMSSRVGAFGDLVAKTPAIDALAAEGVRFVNAFTASGVCAPSRSALIIGVYPQSMGTHQMRTTNLGYLAVPPADVKAFPELLRRVGYATANTVKTDYQFGEPFTVWDANVGDYFSAEDLALWRHLPVDRPWFAMVNLINTHESRLVSANTRGEGQWQGFVEDVRKFRAANILPVTDPADVVVPPYYPDVPAVRASIAQHYDNIHFHGRSGRADSWPTSKPTAWPTALLCCGPRITEMVFPRAKRSVYDSGLRVPLVVRYPDGRDRGRVDQRMVSFVDLAPTLLHLAGVEAPAFMQGRNFLSAEAPREYVFAARDRMDRVPDRVRAVRDARFKYIRNYMPELAYFRPLTFRTCSQ